MDLTSDTSLRTVVDRVLATTAKSQSALDWYSEVESYLIFMNQAKSGRLANREVLARLMDDNPLAATGQGFVTVTPALDDDALRKRFAELFAQSLSEERADREHQLIALYDEVESLFRKRCDRSPRLKMNRALAALLPLDFTTLANIGMLSELNRAFGGSRQDHPVQAHKRVLERLEEVLGPVKKGDWKEIARRMCLPWYIYEDVAQAEQPTNQVEKMPVTGDKLVPLPANRRRRGLLAIAGYFQTLMRYAEELRDGLTRQEFIDVIRVDNSQLKDSSVGTIINSVHREFDIAKKSGDQYVLSARGINLVDTEDPDELADHLLTRIIGVDHIVYALRGSVSLSKGEMYTILQKANPGWTSLFAPSAMIAWLLSLKVIAATGNSYSLTDRGEAWSARVDWIPECLEAGPATPDAPVPTVSVAEFKPPEISALIERHEKGSARSLVFPRSALAELHTALWAQPLRHFVVLAGISGSGKTQLARSYALSLCDDGDGLASNRVLIVPVQPGWYEPSALLGYVNPLEQGYRSTPFLELLQRAGEDPLRPFVVILDEMNLSHPEQYLAPILSAMETGDKIDIHQLADGTTDIPSVIHYPSNLAIIGTVNMDETTHGLSDKVLDRAHTMEFWEIKPEDYPHWDTNPLSTEERDKVRHLLAGLSQALSPVRLHFGWRTINDVIRYLSFSKETGIAFQDGLDAVVYAKVLPKLRGEDSVGFRTALNEVQVILNEASLPRSTSKVLELLNQLAETGAARFWR